MGQRIVAFQNYVTAPVSSPRAAVTTDREADEDPSEPKADEQIKTPSEKKADKPTTAPMILTIHRK